MALSRRLTSADSRLVCSKADHARTNEHVSQVARGRRMECEASAERFEERVGTCLDYRPGRFFFDKLPAGRAETMPQIGALCEQTKRDPELCIVVIQESAAAA